MFNYTYFIFITLVCFICIIFREFRINQIKRGCLKKEVLRDSSLKLLFINFFSMTYFKSKNNLFLILNFNYNSITTYSISPLPASICYQHFSFCSGIIHYTFKIRFYLFLGKLIQLFKLLSEIWSRN